MLSERTMRRELKLVDKLISRFGGMSTTDSDYKNIKYAHTMLIGCRAVLYRILRLYGCEEISLPKLIMNEFYYSCDERQTENNMRYRLG